MGNGQLHMTDPPVRKASGELPAEMERLLSQESPPSSSTHSHLSRSLSFPLLAAALSVTDAACEAAAPTDGSGHCRPVVCVEEAENRPESAISAQLGSPRPPASALLSPLTPRTPRTLPALVRPPPSPSALNRGSLSPRLPPSPTAAALSTPLPPPSPRADSDPPAPVAVSEWASDCPASETDAASASSTAILSLPSASSSASSTTTEPASSSSPSAAPELPRAASHAPKPSWQLDTNEHRSLICRFCGGAQCKHEDYTRQPNYRTAAAIVGLNSSHITPTLIAMQRPSTQLIQTHGIAAQFQQLNITAVINCQQTGEHALCGPGIQAHGFSYHPDDLPHTHHYNFGWVDMGTPPIERMLNIVQVMAMHEMRGGRVAVHCHAGYGRTGIVIACYLIFAHHYSAEMAITTVRQKREGAVQTKEQKRFCYRFEQYIKHLRYQYHVTATPVSHSRAPSSSTSSSSPSAPTTAAATNGTKAAALPLLAAAGQSFQPVSPTPALPPSLSFPLQPHSLSSILINQRLFLHGHERQQYRYASKLVSVLTTALDGQYERLCDEIEERSATAHSVSVRERGSFLLHLPFDCAASWTLEDNSTLDKIKHGANLNDYGAVATASPFIVLVALLHFLTGLPTPLLPFYTYAPTLPTSLSTCFASVPRVSLPTADAVVRTLHGLQFAALVRSSDVRPLSTFVVLAFAFALLHPNCSTPPSLSLLVPADRQPTQPAGRGEAEAKAEAETTEGSETKEGEVEGLMEEEVRREEEDGASLGSMLCFMSVLLTEWHEEHGRWTESEEDERQSTRVGAKKGERWWLHTPKTVTLEAAVTGAASADGAAPARTKTLRATKSSSRRSSGKRPARASSSSRKSRKPELNSPKSRGACKDAEHESKEQSGQAASEAQAVVSKAAARAAKRGSNNRPILPPLKVRQNSANLDVC